MVSVFFYRLKSWKQKPDWICVVNKFNTHYKITSFSSAQFPVTMGNLPSFPFTVVCILVWMKSFPRFWRNHIAEIDDTSYEQAAFLHWDEAIFFLFFWKKNKTGRLKNKYIWIRLQTGVKWLFLAQFGPYLKTQKAKHVFLYCQRSFKTAPAVIKNLFGGINRVYKAVGSIIDCTSCTCKASTKWKCSKVVFSVWVGQSEFSKGWSDCYWSLEVADTQIG